MGRGDVKTKKGKINRGSYGNSRPKTTATKAPAPTAAA
jgi:ribosomal small subunit protein bTHX